MVLLVQLFRLRLTVLALLTCLTACAVCLAFGCKTVRAGEGRGFSQAELIDGFHKSVFGLEYGTRSYGSIVKKFSGPVRLHVVNVAKRDRTAAVAAFVGRLRGAVPGLNISLVSSSQAANFLVYVVDRTAYLDTVKGSVLGSHAGAAPGQCLVRVEPGSGGIRRSTAVIVSDEGESLFRRCMVEEILQGLGPMNDNASLVHSVFNDRSRFDSFMPFDRMLVSMLYDRRIRHGMSQAAVDKLLPSVAAGLGLR